MEEVVIETENKEENIPVVPAEQAMTTTKEEATEALAAKLPEPTTLGSILDSPESFLQTAKMAKMLSQANMLPKTFAGQPGNCMILIDMAKRSGMSVLFVAQNLYIVSGNPSWSGQACIALINNCGRFTPIKFDEKYVSDTEWECTAYATEKATGEIVRSTTINYKLAKDAGWYDKSGTYWKKMPMQMAKYRAAAFFARTYCPEALFGLYTDTEMKDIHGWEEKPATSKFALVDR